MHVLCAFFSTHATRVKSTEIKYHGPVFSATPKKKEIDLSTTDGAVRSPPLFRHVLSLQIGWGRILLFEAVIHKDEVTSKQTCLVVRLALSDVSVWICTKLDPWPADRLFLQALPKKTPAS